MGVGKNGNLVPASALTPEERATNGRKGGIASGISKRKAKTMREAARIILSAPLADDPDTVAALESMGLEPDQQGAILLAATKKSKYGDIEAARFVRDTSGQAPAQAVELSGPDGGSIGVDLSGYTDDQLRNLLSNGAHADADGADVDGADGADGADGDENGG